MTPPGAKLKGLSQSCGHIGAMLFCLADVISSGQHKLPADATCTDVPCPWAKPKGAGVHPKVLRDIDTNITKSTKSQKAMAKYRDYLKQEEVPLGYQEAMDLRLGLMSATQHLGVFVPAVHALHCSRFDITLQTPVLPQHLPQVAMEHDPRLVFSTEISVLTGTPEPLACVFERLKCESYNLRDQNVRQGLLDSIQITEEERELVEEGTRGQNQNVTWYHQRMGSITSSQIENVRKSLTPGSRISKERLVDTCMGARFKHLVSPPRQTVESLKWGQSHEETARNDYRKWTCEVQKHSNVTVHESGLQVHPLYPFIRASPDGIIKCTCCEDSRLLEIKCPYVARNVLPTEGIDSGMINYAEHEGPSDFMLSQTRTGREYYAQVQCCMAVTGCKSCDFVIWTTQGSIIFEIKFDRLCWLELQNAASTFYRDYVIPVMITGKNSHDSANENN